MAIAPQASEAAAIREITAHIETVHLTIVQYVPTHLPRKNEPSYVYFNATRKRLKAAGKLICWRCGTTTNIQLHHAVCEYCSVNGIDPVLFQHHYPELMPDATLDSLLKAVESEGGTMPLCQPCHTGKGIGIHYAPYPNWILGCYWRKDLPPPLLAVGTTALVLPHAA